MSTLDLQPDIYQRYSVVARIAAAVRTALATTSPLRVLDIGCGPVPLTAQFLGPEFTITRADVQTFGQPDMVLLTPGEPLPFADRSVPLVLALEVLEHLPAEQRQAFVAECARVTSGALVLCCPQGTEDVKRAEGLLQRLTRRLSGGRGLDFLDEHHRFGLPTPESVVAAVQQVLPAVVEFPNAPLGDWIVYGTFDMAYACDFGDGPEKAAFNRVVNGRLPLTDPSQAHYRIFVTGCRSAEAAAAVRESLDELPSRAPADPLAAHLALAEAVETFRRDLKRKAAADIEAADERHRQHLATLEAAMRADGDAAASKDARLGAGGDTPAPATSAAEHEPEPRTIAPPPARAPAQPQRAAALVRKVGTSIRLRLPRLGRGSHGREVREAVTRSGLFDPAYYAARTPGAARARDPLGHFLSQVGAAAAPPHPLFEPSYYVAHNPGAGLVNPLVHLLQTPPHEAHHPHPLFDTQFYVDVNPDVQAIGDNPLVHFVRHGATGRYQPHPLFDAGYYVAYYPDVAAAGVNPLVHWLLFGATERRRPHPIIDLDEYLQRNADLGDGMTNPLVHYVLSGGAEGRRLTWLFDPEFYQARYPDVAQSLLDPLVHYLWHGVREGRWPNPFFDPAYYLAHNPDVRKSGLPPLSHYAAFGAAEGRRASDRFDTAYYLASNPEVAAAGVNPLAHYLQTGQRQGRSPTRPRRSRGATDTFVPPAGLLPWFTPLRVEVDDDRTEEPAVNVLLPSVAVRHMTGGPNTALQIAWRLAEAGVRVRLVATDAPADPDTDPLWSHMLNLTEAPTRPALMEVVDAHDRTHPLAIGANDLFFATAWWTAQMAKYACRQTRHPRFIYLIQDYEPLLHAASTTQALAEETYGLDYVPIVNSSLLREYLEGHGIGRFGDESFATRALWFEPAVDRGHFHPEPTVPDRPRRLLFYTRPTNGLRNLFELGVAALMKAVADGAFADEHWELLGIGEPFEPVPLGGGLTLTPAPWLDFRSYAAQMRQADVMLALMLSPHPSYPPLEMAACGGQVVTTAFATKNSRRLSALSPSIHAAAATIEGVSAAISQAVDGVRRETGRVDRLKAPATWNESLAPVMDGLRDVLFDWWDVPRRDRGRQSKIWPASGYEGSRFDALATRALQIHPSADRGLVSFVTPVWETDPAMLRALALTLQPDADEQMYEWVILDNGSTSAATRSALEEIARNPAVRLVRSETNLGIVGGLRRLLEQARHRYVAFVDHDDVVTPDCPRVLAAAIRDARYPALLYTDEDALAGGTFSRPYFKPDWDPVLFSNSCYTAHLSVVDRRMALALGACTDAAAEGSYDWDTFTRFVLAGHEPVHVPHVLYSWRMHEASTATSLAAKPYVLDSQRAVLKRLLHGRNLETAFDIVPSPLFDSPGDWWLRRRPERVLPLTTVVFGSGAAGENPEFPAADGHDHVILGNGATLDQLGSVARACAAEGRFVHLLLSGLQIAGMQWASEALGLFELFPDTAMVGGRVHRDGRIVAAGCHFGTAMSCESPDLGIRLDAPGYFSQHLKPHSVDAVPVWHAVVRAEFLEAALQRLGGVHVTFAVLGAWLGAHARRTGRRVVYSPFLEAEAPTDLQLPTDREGEALFAAVNGDLLEERVRGRGSQFAESGSPGVLPEAGPATGPPAPACRYEECLTARELVRSVGALRGDAPGLSVITTVYQGSDARLLDATANSALPQLEQGDQWILLAQGPVTAETDQVLRQLEAHPAVRVLRRPENLGIVGGMRICLEAARAEYVCPVDGDDLLTRDALAVLRRTSRGTQAVLVYSDEDFLVNERPTSPYLRPDFDAVLNFESSWIWHLCAFDRAAALAVDVYSDAGADYCPDWDTATRLAAVGSPIAHAREVLYHWRRHMGSSTNNAAVHPGSMASVRHILERQRASLANPGKFELQPFPIFRGAEEPYLGRHAGEGPTAACVLVAETVHEDGWTAHFAHTYPFVSSSTIVAGSGFVQRLRASIVRAGVRLVAFAAASIRPQPHWMWEAVRLFELHPQTAVCCGRVTDAGGMVASGPEVFDGRGGLRSDLAGLSAADPGPFALALKPHQVASACPDLFVVDAEWLLEVLPALPETLDWDALAVWLSATAWEHERWVVYSPLLEGRSRALPSVREAAPVHRAARGRLREMLGGRVLGTGGFSASPRWEPALE